ncbi:hypothetical protein A9K75_07125 [Campylobacter fetus subsp. testudinum]|uniref:hypothetical protein n=1 Tax=Campylobacter fetus TaxID=196 RepID=UPI000818B03E|nr:hypothetical protein [Campylobacter fetus]OCR99416.1 hypothetical protein A9K75_07125 [Campylobacter fetus subsp. testudinum]
MFKTYGLLLLVFCISVFSGCATLSSERSQSITLLIKSKNLKINDAGFIHFYKNYTNLQIYASGKNILDLRIKDQICINGACDDKLVFNRKFFLSSHYAELLEDILNQNPIYFGADLITTSCGFEQIISKISVEYKVCDGKMSFVDQKNDIKIIMKEVD